MSLEADRRRPPLALGVKVKSGRAIVVAVSGDRTNPEVVLRREIALSDPGTPATRQPYHDGFGTAQTDQKTIERLTGIVERSAKRSITALLDEMAGAALHAKRSVSPSIRACLVVGSLIDPATVGNPHIRAHANEGRLFRRTVEEALRDHEIECDVVVEKTLAAGAATSLGRDVESVKRTVGALGRSIGGSWRSDEKSAATAAWMILPASK